jgi:hypothetical protein
LAPFGNLDIQDVWVKIWIKTYFNKIILGCKLINARINKNLFNFINLVFGKSSSGLIVKLKLIIMA